MTPRGRLPGATRQRTGRFWEDAASEYLAKQGIETLLRGYRCRLGELDLVCAEDERLVVVEVRARSASAYAGALVSVDARKRRKIVLATRHLLMRHPSWYHRPLRFDVVAFERIDSASPELLWIRNAFDANG
jgi:putative endonuclease